MAGPRVESRAGRFTRIAHSRDSGSSRSDHRPGIHPASQLSVSARCLDGKTRLGAMATASSSVRLLRTLPRPAQLRALSQARRAPSCRALSSRSRITGDRGSSSKNNVSASGSASHSGGFSESSGRPSRRVPAPRSTPPAKDNFLEGKDEKDKEEVTRATAAVAAKGSDMRGSAREKGKGKEKEQSPTELGEDEEPIKPITSGSSLDHAPSLSSSTESQPKEETATLTTSDLNAGPLDIASIPSLRSSFEEPLVGLSPSLGGSAAGVDDPSSGTNTTTAASFIAQSPSADPEDAQARQRRAEGDSGVDAALSLLPRHSFNTNRFVSSLESSSFSRPLSTSLLSATHAILSSSQRRVLTDPSSGAVSKAHAEGQAYLYSAALSELRTEVQVKARNDGIALRSVVNGLQREVEALRQRLGEDVGTLRGEIQIDMNMRKEEGSTEMKGLEMSILELNSKVRRPPSTACIFRG